MQVLENMKDDWPLLLDAWYEFYEKFAPMTAVTVYKTVEGKKYLKEMLELLLDMFATDCPPVIAWDPVKKQVCRGQNHICSIIDAHQYIIITTL